MRLPHAAACGCIHSHVFHSQAPYRSEVVFRCCGIRYVTLPLRNWLPLAVDGYETAVHSEEPAADHARTPEILHNRNTTRHIETPRPPNAARRHAAPPGAHIAAEQLGNLATNAPPGPTRQPSPRNRHVEKRHLAICSCHVTIRFYRGHAAAFRPEPRH